MEQPMACGSGLSHGGMEQQTLCPPLQRLRQEHTALRKAMEDYQQVAASIVAAPDEGGSERFAALYDQIARFKQELKAHARREDEVLFPMMARYIGREAGPIAVMEYEHEQAEQQLQRFLEEGEAFVPEQIPTVTRYALEAYETLVQHFAKEEQVLFPMAEHLLSAEEKTELDRRI
jgi:regulator of cell morphogenesis and NO signaling